MDQTRLDRLRADIDVSGYYPELVWDSVRLALDDEELLAHLVHHEATFTREEIHRHVTVLALTGTRLIVAHTDETDASRGEEPGGAASTTESIPLREVNVSAVTRVVGNPARFGAGGAPVTEAWLTVGWGAMQRMDLEPATCADPTCEADHGFTGTVTCEDLTVRVSATADGADRVGQLVAFGTRLQRLSAEARAA